ncbi:MAG: WD40 repeat domain-containing protein [Armatimonadetes bacterium]|nr:WD40 repeat domain-containing protein [Armatimonadota bacterium]
MKVAWIVRPASHSLKRPATVEWSPDGRHLICLWDQQVWWRHAETEEWHRTDIKADHVGCTWREGLVFLEIYRSGPNPAVYTLDLRTGVSHVLLTPERAQDLLGNEDDKIWSLQTLIPSRGRAVALAGYGQNAQWLRLYSVPGKLLPAGSFHSYRVQAAISPDGTTAAIGLWSSKDHVAQAAHTIKVVSLLTGKSRNRRLRDRAVYLEWSPRGQYLGLLTDKHGLIDCACGFGGRFALVDVRTWRVRRFPQCGAVSGFSWSPDGRYVLLTVAPDSPGRAHLLDLHTKRLCPVPKVLRGPFSPDGRYLLASGESHRERFSLFDVAGRRIRRASRRAAFIPTPAIQGQWVYPLVPRGTNVQTAEMGSADNFWVRLGAACGIQVGDDLWCGPFGNSRRKLIARNVYRSAWWPPPYGSQGRMAWSRPG